MPRKGSKRRSELFLTIVTMAFFSIGGVWISPVASPLGARLDTEVSLSLLMKTMDMDTAESECTSPEKHISLPLQDSTMSLFHFGTASRSPLEVYFRSLSTDFEKKYGEQCKAAVRFGVAFGEHHVNMLSSKFPKKQTKCAFMFVLEEEMPLTNSRKSFSLDILVPIPRHVLPYKCMRRNVKLIKLNGHKLFTFTKLLVWKDAKLPPKQSAKYYSKFLKTSQNTACFAAVGLPVHTSSFGNTSLSQRYIPQYQDHCDTVAHAIIARPNVTDSVDSLLHQCRLYQEQAIADTVPLNRGLIDSAFIVWNQKYKRCKAFNQELASLWASEIQCHADRDQISFPRVLQKMGLREHNETTGKNASKHSLLLVDESNQTMIQLLRSKCHWYFRKFPELCTS